MHLKNRHLSRIKDQHSTQFNTAKCSNCTKILKIMPRRVTPDKGLLSISSFKTLESGKENELITL